MNETMDYEKIMSDRKLFNKTVYTPLSQALKILEERRQDKVLVAKIKELLKNDIPDFLLDKKYRFLWLLIFLRAFIVILQHVAVTFTNP